MSCVALCCRVNHARILPLHDISTLLRSHVFHAPTFLRSQAPCSCVPFPACYAAAVTSAPSLPAEDVARWRWIWLVAWIAMALSELAVLGSHYLNQDVAWFCYMARRWLDGATLYRDVVDTNPPAIVWLTVPPVWLSGATGVAVPGVFIAYVGLIVTACARVCAALLKRAWPDASEIDHRLVLTAIVFCALPLAGKEYGQREHLALLLALPYVITAAVRLAGRPLTAPVAVALGAFAGLALGTKPHLLAVAVFVEAVLIVSRRSLASLRRPEAIAMAATVAAYPLAVLVWFPEYPRRRPHRPAGLRRTESGPRSAALPACLAGVGVSAGLFRSGARCETCPPADGRADHRGDRRAHRRTGTDEGLVLPPVPGALAGDPRTRGHGSHSCRHECPQPRADA